MRIVDFSKAAQVGVVVLSLTLGSASVSRAQLPPPNPLVAPVPAPSAPAPLPAPVQPEGLPSLAVVPSPPAALPTPVARTFNCSCFGPATGTSWAGQVSASGYFAARQAATGACLTYNKSKHIAPPVVQTNQPVSVVPQGFENPNASSSLASTLPGALNFSTTQQQTACSQCACN